MDDERWGAVKWLIVLAVLLVILGLGWLAVRRTDWLMDLMYPDGGLSYLRDRLST